mgnify:CR=1 FL=1
MTFHLHEIARVLACSRGALEAAMALEPFYQRGLPYPISHPLWRMGFHDDGAIIT